MRIRCISLGAPHVATYDVSTTLNVCVYVCVFWGDVRVSVRTRYYVSMNDMQLVPHGTYVPGNRCTNKLF